MSTPSPRTARLAAGLRGAFWTPERTPAGMKVVPHILQTQDGAAIVGYLHSRGGERSVVVTAHPREHSGAHYLVPELLDGGFAVWAQPPRSVNNDLRLEHEMALYDLAAALQALRDQGFERIAVLGNSGGGALWSLYVQQALAAPEARLANTSAGRPTKLAAATLPLPDAVVFVSAHPGQGAVLMNLIDPSVTDERDAFSVDPSLSPFEPGNGFMPPPESSHYAPDFLQRYRAAQRERVARIDRFAREQVAERNDARRRAKETGSAADRARAAYTCLFQVWRTDADPRCWDLSLDPSPRRYGSLWGADPYVSNFGSVGFARLCTPESWLSTWSGLSTRASMQLCAPAIELPTLMIDYTGDNMVFPADADALFEMIGTRDKRRVSIDGDHHGRALRPGTDPRAEAGRTLRGWLREQCFPTTVTSQEGTR
ncbi:MAG: alpha/beta hydrolase [Burkholderiaceae bacterium]